MVGAVGINVSWVFAFVFVIGCFLAGLGGALIAPIVNVTLGMDHTLIMEAFLIVIMGGLGKNRGAVIGGFAIGILEAMTAGYVHSGLKDAVALLILLSILFFRPAGILGSKAMMQMRKF